jgi:hypothetical protein
MKQYSTPHARASLAVLAQQMERMRVWQIITDKVDIPQKVVCYHPLDKLKMAFLNQLCAGRGISEINSRVRPDGWLCHLFGLKACAEQSTVSRTLDACDQSSVMGMRNALQTLFQGYSKAYRHRYGQAYQILDIDVTGLLAGRQGEGVCGGYFGALGLGAWSTVRAGVSYTLG